MSRRSGPEKDNTIQKHHASLVSSWARPVHVPIENTCNDVQMCFEWKGILPCEFSPSGLVLPSLQPAKAKLDMT